MILASLLLSLSAAAWAQNGYVYFQDFSGGLNTYQNSLLIAPNESQSLDNVILDKVGGISRRQGRTKINSIALGDGSHAINAVYKFDSSNGSHYCVAFAGSTGAYSTDACQTFTVFITTLTVGNDVNCDSFSDKLFCVNNQYNFYFNGTATTFPVSQMPANLKYIKVHRNRCFASGSSSNLSRLYWSALGDCTSWTTGTDYVDISPNDGDVVTGIGTILYDMIPVYKKYSSWALKGVDPNTFDLVNISKDIGSLNHRSISNHPLNGTQGIYPIQLFDSVGPNGGQPGIYGFDGITIREMSKKLRNDLDQIDTFRAVTNRKIIDSQADFQAGTFDPFAMSAVRAPGLMESTFTTINDNTSANFDLATAMVNVSTSVSNTVVVSMATNTFINAGAESTDFTNWVLSAPGGNGFQNINQTICAQSAGDMNFSAKFGSYVFSTGAHQPNVECGDTGSISILDGTTGVLQSSVPFTLIDSRGQLTSPSWQDNKIDLSGIPSKTIKVKYSFVDSFQNTQVLTSSPIVRGKEIDIWTTPCNSRFINGSGTTVFQCKELFDIDETIPQITSGSFTSQCFDTSISTPIYGDLTVTMTTQTDSGLSFQTKVATSCSGVFDTPVSSDTSGVIQSASKRYFEYVSSFTINAATDAPAFFTSVSLTAASTGTWTSPELLLSNNISAGGFGLFQTVQNLTGNASIKYAIRGSTYAGGTANVGYTDITPGNSITLSTGAYFQLISTFTITAATETANLDVVVINWNEGTQAKSSAGIEFQNRYHYAAQSLNGSMNDRIYVLDSNGAWTKWDNVFARSMAVINQNFVIGGASTTSGGYLYRLYNTDSDDGQAINAYYQTKDYDFGKIVDQKSVDRLFLAGSNDATTLTLNLIGNTGLYTNTYSVPLSTGMAYKVVQIPVFPAINGNAFSLKIGNNAPSAPWSVYGMGVQARDVGLMQP